MDRRKWGTPIWHTTPQCLHWPDSLECEERAGVPDGAQVCGECLSLQTNAAPPTGMLPAVLRDVLG